MLLKSKKSKQRIVESKKLFGNLINNIVSQATYWEKNLFPAILPFLLRFAAYLLEGFLIFSAKFSEKVSNE